MNSEAKEERWLHRELDNLGKFGIQLQIYPKKKMSRSEVTDFINRLLMRIANNCATRGADLIGHIKAHFKTASGNIRASLVNPESGVSVESDLSSDDIESMVCIINTVVHGIWDSEVTKESMRAIKDVCREFNSKFEIISKEGLTW
jgi:hypothetical protein